MRFDGKEVASASQDGSVRLWSITSGQVIRTLHASEQRMALEAMPAAAALNGWTDAIRRIKCSVNRIVTGGFQGQLLLWNRHTGAPLMPLRVAQLSWLGLSPQALQTLSPHITVLPTPTPVNLNTASVQVLYASVPGLGLADAQRLVQQRERQHWLSVDAFQKALGRTVSLNDTHSVNTRYFEVMGRLRMPQTVLQERSLVQRDASDLKVIWRHTSSLQ